MSFRLNEKKANACHSSACIFVLTVSANRVGNFKHMNVELQTSKLSKVGSK
jgi:hypothetical protein